MTKFSIDCTLPPEGMTFVEAPNARGTLNIVYSCLTVIVLCTWGVQHLNVPLQTLPRSKRQKFVRTLSRTSTKVKWMAFNVLAPEFPFAQAVCGLLSERAVREEFDHFKQCDKVPWTRSHTQLANMEGFIIRFDQSLQTSADRENTAEQNDDVHCPVGQHCCNRFGTASPWSLWCRAQLRKIGILMRIRSSARENESVAMRHRSLSSEASDNPHEQSNSPSTHGRSTDSIFSRASSIPVSFDRAIQDEHQSTMSLPARLASEHEGLNHLVYPDPSRQPAMEMFLQILRYDYVWGCPHDIRTSLWSGDTTWELDNSNIAVARAAIATLDLQHFDNEAMIRSFLSSQPTMWLTNLRVLCGNQWSLDAKQLLLARRLGIISKLPSITEDEIDDVNKSDLFVKILAVFQILWLLTQLCTRLARQIPTTQLEIVTLAFTICSISTYFLFLSRPKDVQTAREINAVRYPTAPEMTQIATVGPFPIGPWRGNVSMPNNSIHWPRGWPFALSTNVLVVIFGALHVVSWNYDFPTRAEKTLWRASIGVTIITGPMWSCVATFALVLRGQASKNFLVLLQFHVIAPVFVAARIFILVEVVRSLAYQPPEAFRSTWAAELPHTS